MSHGCGVGKHLAALLAKDLETVERHGTRREQVAVCQDQTVAAPHDVCSAVARQRAAAFGKAPRHPAQRKRIGQRKCQRVRPGENRRKVPQKQQPGTDLQRREDGEHKSADEDNRQHDGLPAAGETRRAAAALRRAARGVGNDIRRVANRRDAERVIKRLEQHRTAPKRAGHGQRRDGVQRQRRAGGARVGEKRHGGIQQRRGAQQRRQQLVGDLKRHQLFRRVLEHLAPQYADEGEANEIGESIEQSFLRVHRRHPANVREQLGEPHHERDKHGEARHTAGVLHRVTIFCNGFLNGRLQLVELLRLHDWRHLPTPLFRLFRFA